MKKQQIIQTSKYTCCSPRQKVLWLVALGGLFACGLMIGVAINGQRSTRLAILQEQQCERMAQEIQRALNAWDKVDMVRLTELNQIYSKNCSGYVPESERENRAPNSETSNMETCAVIENILLRDVRSEDSKDAELHINNIDIYKRLIRQGCPENVNKYQALVQREQDILAALTNHVMSDDRQACSEIESLLEQWLLGLHLDDSQDRIERAKIYANLSERGCAENAAKYTDLAARELEIARALRDDKFSERETTEVVETYKRLEMKQQAKEVLNKVQKLTDPAIDFILQVQKIIEE